MKEKETLIQAKILKHLHSQGYLAFRVNNGSVYDAHLRQYRSFAGMKGVPDIIAVGENGKFIGCEVKKEKGGVQSPEQFIFQQRLEEAGGVYILARSVEDVAEKLSTHMC